MNVSIKIPNISYVDLVLIQNHAIQIILRVFYVSKNALFVTTTFIPVIKNSPYKPKTSLNNPHLHLTVSHFVTLLFDFVFKMAKRRKCCLK